MSPQCIALEPNLNFSPKTELIFLPQSWSSALVNGLLLQQKNVLRPAFTAQASPQHIWGGGRWWVLEVNRLIELGMVGVGWAKVGGVATEQGS